MRPQLYFEELILEINKENVSNKQQISEGQITYSIGTIDCEFFFPTQL